MKDPQKLKTNYIDISAGRVAYVESSGRSVGRSVPLLLIHGNSASKEFMKKQVEGLGKNFKVIVFDLPGHGESSNALNPASDYTLPGYAKIVEEMIHKLGLGPVILVGWSLGGHIAMEFMARSSHLLKGVVIISAPPLTPTEEGFKQAYLPTYSSSLGSKTEPFTPEEVKEYMTQGGIDFDRNPELLAAGVRAHGLARYIMVDDVMKGNVQDERSVVETCPVPLAFILGKHEHAINNDYIQSLDYANCTMLEVVDGGHDMQWSHADKVNALIRQFMSSL